MKPQVGVDGGGFPSEVSHTIGLNSFIFCKSIYLKYKVKSGKFGHTFANNVNLDETAPYEASHQYFHCLLSSFA